MLNIFVVKFSDLPAKFIYAPYFISVSSSEEELVNDAFSEYGKPLAMWKCDSVFDARRWAKYLKDRSRLWATGEE